MQSNTHIMGGISTEARGGKFWSGFASGAAASFVSTITGISCQEFHVPDSWTKAAMVAAGGLSGGVSASMAGGDFWEGMCNGLICSGLNHAMHLACETMDGPDDPPGKTSKNKSDAETKAMEGSAIIGGEATLVKAASELAIGKEKVAILSDICKWSKRIGYAGVLLNIGINTSKAINGEISWTSFAVRLGVTVGEVGIAAIPFVGPVLSTIVVCYDIGGGFDNTLYDDNWINNKTISKP